VNIRTLLPARLLDLVCLAVPYKSVMRLELLHRLAAVVDKREASALATTELRPEAEDGNLILAALVQLRELLAEFIFGNIRAVRVENVTVAVLC
jgi:hypothetical protein